MAEEHPPSPKSEANNYSLRRLRVKPAMTVKGKWGKYKETSITMLTKNTIKQVASLRQQKFRKELGLFVVEGRKMVEELLLSCFETVGLYATEAFLADNPSFTEAEIASEVQMQQMSGQDTPPGILAVVRIPEQGDVKTSSRFVLALDGIANPGNMGTLIRTAEWFGISDVVCSMDCVELWNPKTVQATMGSLFRVKVWKTDLAAYLQKAKGEDKAVYGALLEGENLFQLKAKPEGVLVIGSEAHGISDATRAAASALVKLPMRGGAESLNAAVAAGIMMYELMRE